MFRVVPLAALLLAGCTAPRGVAQYPTRDIDRPYTLPANFNTWSASFATIVAEGEDTPPAPDPDDQIVDREPTEVGYVINPLAWAWSVGPVVTVEGSLVFPHAARVAVLDRPRHVVGARVDLSGRIRALLQGSYREDGASLFHRYRPGGSWALETRVGVSRMEDRDDGELDHGASISTGPRVQLRADVSARPFAVVGVTRGDSTGDYGAYANTGVSLGWNIGRWRLVTSHSVYDVLAERVIYAANVGSELIW